MNIIESLPNKTGLKKIGNLSNINAIIQSLINLDKLSNYLMPIFNQNNISIQQQPLSYSLML
jgi:ubiquitin C-terminal hydrolase